MNKEERVININNDISYRVAKVSLDIDVRIKDFWDNDNDNDNDNDVNYMKIPTQFKIN